MITVRSYAQGRWVEPSGKGSPLLDAATGEQVAELKTGELDYRAMAEYARQTGGPTLRKMTIHERAYRIKDLAKYLIARKERFYELSQHTGATKADSWIDIDGGISSLFVISSKARREMNDDPFYVDGPMEQLSREGTFIGQHLCVPLHGVAVQINAFNFPVWGMLEKLGPAIIAGMPVIVKPAPAGSYLTQAVVESMLESELLPEGALQFIAADKPGDLLDHLTNQDVIAFTGSKSTGDKLRTHPNIIKNSVRFNMETDSLNCSILGSDVSADQPEFDLFVKEVTREMTSKAGQKCTAIRRALVHEDRVDDVIGAIKKRLEKITVGDPSSKDVKMGALASDEQKKRLRQHVDELLDHSELAYGELNGEPNGQGAFSDPLLLYCKRPLQTDAPHQIEAFGPVCTVMPYQNEQEAVELARKGEGSLVGSMFTADDDLAKRITLEVAPWHGRFMIINRHSAGESTGHGSPMPHLMHGGPGRAGGGEELGGIRSILHYMQRTALQGSPTTLTKISNTFLKGSETTSDRIHPFRKYFEELQVGERHVTHRRTVTEADIVNFGCLSGDHFYAHFDDIAAKDSFFEERVAHGYFVLSAAAGLFVDPAPGPVMANYGLDDLRFVEPVRIGDTIQAKLTVKSKVKQRLREEHDRPRGIVKWDVEVVNQREEVVAMYDILTLVERQHEE